MTTLGEIAAAAEARLQGCDAATVVVGVAPLHSAEPGHISFLTHPRYRSYLATTQATAVILSPEDARDCPAPALVAANPHVAYARAATLFEPAAESRRGIHATAWVSPTATVAADAWIGPHCAVEAGAVIETGVIVGPGCVIGEQAVIGAGSRLVARVTVCHRARVGRRVLAHPGVVIGGDGFGLALDREDRWLKVPQLGGVVIGDDVEIGANTTIDRGALEDTVIEEGVKLDNQIQVAHNVRIGAHSALAGCVGIAGSARIGRHCMVGGGVGIAGHLEIADRVQITGMSLVTQSITRPGTYSSGLAVEPNRLWNKISARLRRLDELFRRLTVLERTINRDSAWPSRIQDDKDRSGTMNESMDIQGILEYLPHRYPFLLIDRVLAVEPGQSLTGLKNVSFNEPFFLGHFPQRPIMPGVLILEALAQATGILAFKSEREKPDHRSMYYLVGVDNARFKRPVGPGDQLILEVRLDRIKRGIGKFLCEAKVDGQLAASADLMCAKRDIDL